MSSPSPLSGKPDTADAPNEYIPPSSPPSLPTSESMRRITALLSAAKLTTTDQLTFSYNGSEFIATITSSGALSSPAPRPSSIHPTRLSPNVQKLYESPKDFASEMALVAVNSDPKKTKPRGKLSINGWEQCMVGHRSLDSLRHQMLREKKPSTAPLPKSDQLDLPNHHPKPQPETTDPKPTEVDHKDMKEHIDQTKESDTEKNRVKAETQPPNPTVEKDPADNGGKTVHSKPEPPNQKKDSETKPVFAVEKPLVQSSKAESDNAKGTECGITTEAKERTLADDAVIEKEMRDVEPVVHTGAKSDAKHSPMPAVEDDAVEERARDQTTGDSKSTEEKPSEAKSAEENASMEASGAAGDTKTGEENARKAGEPEAAREQGSERKTAEDKASEANIVKENAKSHKSIDKDEKPSSPPAKQESKKRKRSDSKDSSPSEENSPSRRSQERGGNRIEWGRKGRKLDIPSASDLTTEGLDPEAIEAAEIAAQAEKEEASSRARRTTRLASGKIKLVDYKASAIAQGSRSLSPGREFDDVDNFHSNDSGAEPVRTSRRRLAQNHTVPPQRSSRRVARKRGSQERDQSSADDLDHSSPGNGSDGFGDGDNGGQEKMNIDIGAGSRLNGGRAEGRERRLARGEGGSRRTRQNHSELADFDADDKAHYGTRSSTRENSVVDAGEMLDGDPTENETVDEGMQKEKDPEKRTDRYGWTIQDLTRIGDAVDIADSTEQQNINVELYQAGNWTTDEATSKTVAKYVQDAISCIATLKKEVIPDVGDEVSVTELRSFIATDIWRLKSGGLETEFPRKPANVLARAGVEEQLKVALERTRRKLQREVEELRRDLDSEMVERRKADLDVAYVEIQLSATSRNLPREEARRLRLEREMERYRVMEMRTRTELDRTKILVSQLRGETDSPDDIPSLPKNTPLSPPQVKQEECENDDLQKSERVLAESVTSEEDVGMKPKEAASPSERQIEMERLRVLIAAREAEADANQRACEMEKMKFISVLEAKNRVESELYSHRVSGSFGHGGGVSGSPGFSTNKSGKDSVRKGEGRHGGPGVHRGQSTSRSRATKPATGGPSGGTSHKASGANKPKNGAGKSVETSKGVKKKTSTRVQNSPGPEKQ